MSPTISLCSPALIYLIFSITQLLIDISIGHYNTFVVKLIVVVMVTFLLQSLCNRNMGLISWLIVFIPFVLMTLMVTILLYIFGLDVATGTLDYDCKQTNKKQERINNRQKRVETHSENYELNERTYGTSGYPPLGYTSDPMYTS